MCDFGLMFVIRGSVCFVMLGSCCVISGRNVVTFGQDYCDVGQGSLEFVKYVCALGEGVCYCLAGCL